MCSGFFIYFSLSLLKREKRRVVVVVVVVEEEEEEEVEVEKQGDVFQKIERD